MSIAASEIKKFESADCAEDKYFIKLWKKLYIL
jgi:hypothetical protein